jgi:Tryptophan/tyrosine permease family
MLGSMAIAINSLTGPAMLNLPATYVRSGIIPTTTTLIFVCLLSSRCSLHMANTISKVPNNIEFQQEVEYSDVFRHFLGSQWYITTQIIFLCCITCLNISSIVDTSQVVDTFIGNWIPGGTVALQLFSHSTQQQYEPDAAEFIEKTFFWHIVQFARWDRSECTTDEVEQGLCLPFAGCDGILLTLGTLITTLLFLPLALLDLKENAWWQVAGLLILLIVSLQFLVQFAMTGLKPSNLTWWGDDWNDLLGVIIFNFALVIAIPAWLYEREPHVDVPLVINYSSFVVVILYMLIGLLGAMAIPHVADNMLESMMSGAFGTMLSLGASLFAFAIVGLGIPLFSVLTRLNLTGSGLCSLRTGNMLAVYGPFAAAWMLYDGQAITKLLSWGGIIFTSLVAFILPLILSIYVVRTNDTAGSIQVYGDWYKTKKAHLTSLYVLFAMACLSIFVAILGNLVDFDGTPDDPPQ